MRLPFSKNSFARRVPLKTLTCVFCVCMTAACSLDGASKKDAATQAPRTSQMPRTSLPMPPVESARSTSERAAGAWTMPDGRRESLADYRGQVVVLDFYATYCPPCKDEIPHLVTLQRRYGAQGFKVIGLNVGGAEDQAKVPEFVRELDIQYELANPDEDTVNLFLTGNTAIPQTLVFDRRGRLVEHFTGFDTEVASRLEDAVRNALGEKSGSSGE